MKWIKSSGLVAVGIFLVLLITPIAYADNLAFTPEERDMYLSPFSKIVMSVKDFFGFTIAGQERECSVYPDEAGYITSIPKIISCNGQEGLINFYAIQADGTWKYMTEVDCPANFNPATYSSPIQKWAYEVYYCPEIPEECSSGEKVCKNEKTTLTCVGGSWTESSCGINKVCSQGTCIAQAECSVYDKKFAVGGHPDQYKMCVSGNYVTYDCPEGRNIFDVTVEDCISESTIPPVVNNDGEVNGGTTGGSGLPNIPIWLWGVIALLLLLAFSPILRAVFPKLLRGGR